MKAVLDACVLFPTLTRGLLLDAATAGVFTPLWSARIRGEWTHAVSKTTPPDLVAAESALLTARWPDAEILIPDGIEAGLHLPDPDDTHVLAAAIAGQASAIVTYNMRDFPGRTLATHGVQPWHPDVFLLEALKETPDRMLDATRARLTSLNDPNLTPRAALKRARLPRFAKAINSLL